VKVNYNGDYYSDIIYEQGKVKIPFGIVSVKTREDHEGQGQGQDSVTISLDLPGGSH
jgi:hypothetical protein